MLKNTHSNNLLTTFTIHVFLVLSYFIASEWTFVYIYMTLQVLLIIITIEVTTR